MKNSENVATEQEVWNFYNGLLCSSDVSRLRKLLVRNDLFRLTINIPGDIVECGVFKGAGMMFWRKLLEIYSPGAPKKVIGFDTFSEYAASCQEFELKEKDKFVKEAAFAGIDLEDLRNMFRSASFGNEMELVPGDIQVSAAAYAEKNRGFRISLLNLDFDTYLGTKSALEAFYPLVSRGGVIIFDEYGKAGWGESEAVDEFFRDKPEVKVHSVPHSSGPTAYAIKP